MVSVANEWHAQEQRFFNEFIQPAIVRKLRIAESEIVEAFRVSIDERRSPELLSESTELAKRSRSLHQIDEVRFYSALREESKSFTSIRAFLDAEYLDFQGAIQPLLRPRAEESSPPAGYHAR